MALCLPTFSDFLIVNKLHSLSDTPLQHPPLGTPQARLYEEVARGILDVRNAAMSVGMNPDRIKRPGVIIPPAWA
jgi:hypothetical protein